MPGIPKKGRLEISKLMAQAASKLLSKDQAEVQQKQIEQLPIIKQLLFLQSPVT